MPTEISPGLVVETVGDILDQPRLILGYDTETTGLPLWNDPSDDPRQPHVIQLGMILCDMDGNEVDRLNTLVKPGAGAIMQPEAFAAHGISLERAMDEGMEPVAATDMFLAWVDRAFLRVAHNESFDLRLMRIMAARHKGFKWETDQPNFCTLYKSVGILKLPPTPAMLAAGVRGYKKPNLGECMEGFFGEKLEGAHDAMNDITATMRVFWHLVRDHGVPMVKGEAPVTPVVQSAPIGHNGAPEVTSFEALEEEIRTLHGEARNWLDGEPIANEAQAEEVGKLRDMLRDAAGRAEKQRKAEAKPFDDGKAEVQARYNPLIQKDRGLMDMAIKACNSALAPFLKAKEDAQRAEAQRKMQAAQDQAYEAAKAASEARDSGDLGKRESAEQLINSAKAALGEANRAEKAKPQVAGMTKAIGLKSVWSPTLIDPAAALAHYRKERPAELKAWLMDQAQKDVRAGARAIEGFDIKEDRVAV